MKKREEREYNQQVSLTKRIGWRVFVLSIIISIPPIIWWTMGIHECTTNARIRVSEALGVILMAISIPVLPLLALLWLIISTLYLSFKALLINDALMKIRLLVLWGSLIGYYLLLQYYQSVCPQLYILIAMGVIATLSCYISIRLIRYKESKESRGQST